MTTAFGWVLFGMAVWGLCILMEALERRFAPDSSVGRSLGLVSHRRKRRDDRKSTTDVAAPTSEIMELRKRIETLEAIVTDSRFKWDQDMSSSERKY